MARRTSDARRRQPKRPLAGNDGQDGAGVIIELSKRGDQLCQKGFRPWFSRTRRVEL